MTWCTAIRLQESRAEAEVVAVPRTEAQRRLCGQRAPEAETGLVRADSL